MKRYDRNIPSLSEEESIILQKSKVCVAGCGGLGGYTIELLARLGIGAITVIDGDEFDETNLNRQILSDELNIGSNKAVAAQKRVNLINSHIQCIPIEKFIDENNADSIVKGHDVVIDALDSIPARFILQNACKKFSIPFVYGAVTEWYGQVSTIFPEDDTLHKIYGQKDKESIPSQKQSVLSFTPALISSIQVSEAVKIIINRGKLLRHKLLMIDVQEMTFEEISLG